MARRLITKLPVLPRQVVAFGIVLGCASVAWAQSPDGALVFQASCATCHTGAAESRAPSLEALRTRTPQSVMSSLLDGAMRPQGARLSGAERRAVAEYITGKTLDGDVSGAHSGRCSTPGPLQDFAQSPRWTGWSPSTANTRFQPGEQAGLAPADLRRLKLKWAFGFPDAFVAWSHPTVAAGSVFVGSQNGTVYSLDAKTGCIRWTFNASGGVRTALTVAPAGGSRLAVYFADTAANAYALDAETGRRLWVRRVDDHPSARITGSPTFFEGRLYVPVSSYEESQGADPHYPCCTFRGSISALDAESGAVEWKTYMIAETPERRGTSGAGVPLWGPSGAGVWSAPTIDANRRLLYVATGNAYSAPATPSSDAVVALDLATVAMR